MFPESLAISDPDSSFLDGLKEFKNTFSTGEVMIGGSKKGGSNPYILAGLAVLGGFILARVIS